MIGQIPYMSTEQYIEFTKKRLINTMDINDNGCWIWNGYLCEPKKIYGSTTSTLDGTRNKILAHRLAYRLWNGEIPEGMFVLHSCDTPLCINPDHLHLGTPQDNMDEMKERGRKNPAKGEKNRHAKLKNEDILKIRDLHKNGMSNSDLSKLYSVRTSTMSYILRRKTWKHI